jgi:hypothetical protein
MSSVEEYLLFDHVEELKYEQYGLNDFYWNLSKQIQKEEAKKHNSTLPQKPTDLENDDLALETLLAGDGYFSQRNVANPIFEENSETSSQCSGSLSRASGAKLKAHCSHHHHHHHHSH